MSRFRKLAPSSVLSAALATGLAWPAAAHALDPGALPGNLSLVTRAVGSLAGVVGLIVLLSLLLRRFRDSSRLLGGSSGLRSLGRLDLGGRREIRVVRAGERTLVLGVTERRIDLLTELPATADVAPQAGGDGPSCSVPALRVLQKLTSSS